MKEQEHVFKNKPESKPGSKPDAKDDLKSLPMPEVEKKLGASPDGLTQADAERRLAQYGYNEISEKKTNRFGNSATTCGVPSVYARSGWMAPRS
jgi:magnesium-transporting ATPase (P-type)